MSLQKQNLSETDIIKAVALKRQFETLYNSLNNKEKSDNPIDLNSKD